MVLHLKTNKQVTFCNHLKLKTNMHLGSLQKDIIFSLMYMYEKDVLNTASSHTHLHKS